MKVKFDLSDANGRTPFLTYYGHSNYEMAFKLLTQGANIMQMDNSGLFALKYALIRRENKEIEKLVALGADINQIDTKGRNLLHHAVNMSSATADATFETEQLLIDFGININLRD
jgi:ankyrin repeat protein